MLSQSMCFGISASDATTAFMAKFSQPYQLMKENCHVIQDLLLLCIKFLDTSLFFYLYFYSLHFYATHLCIRQLLTRLAFAIRKFVADCAKDEQSPLPNVSWQCTIITENMHNDPQVLGTSIT